MILMIIKKFNYLKENFVRIKYSIISFSQDEYFDYYNLIY